MQIQKDENKKYKRVYIKFPVRNKATVLKLQSQIIKYIPLKIAPKETLHLTFFHFGKPEEIYQELKNQNKDLNNQCFIQSFLTMLADIRCMEIQEYTFDMYPEKLVLNFNMHSEDLDLFGDDVKNVLVLKLKPNKELSNFRTKVLNRFELFLKENGINNISTFIQSSPNFLHQIQYNPHISLGICDEHDMIPQIDLTDSVFSFQKMIIANVIE